MLVVDDEPLVRADLAMMLEDNGCETYEAGHAAQAIAILEQNAEITVVFTDIQMPGTMDGVALAHCTEHRPRPSQHPVPQGYRHWPPRARRAGVFPSAEFSRRIKTVQGEAPDDPPFGATDLTKAVGAS